MGYLVYMMVKINWSLYHMLTCSTFPRAYGRKNQLQENLLWVYGDTAVPVLAIDYATLVVDVVIIQWKVYAMGTIIASMFWILPPYIGNSYHQPQMITM